MAHNLDQSNDRFNIAFMGSRDDIWHRHGQQMEPGMSIAQWAAAAGLEWSAIRTPAYHQLPDGRFEAVPGWSYNTRNDTLKPLGYVSDSTYKTVQPADVLNWFDRYIGVDDRFGLDVAGSLDGGSRIWATATYNGDLSVAGDKHKARLLMTTSYDTTQATINKATMTRVVCQNTLSAALADPRAEVRTSHSATFNPKQVGDQLSKIAAGFQRFKVIGDAMGLVEMADREVSNLFKDILEIDRAAQADELSTRKMNQFNALRSAYSTTVHEGTPRGTVWTALNAVTRYVDHDRGSRSGDSPDSARFDSALFGSGAAIKTKTWNLLMPLVKDRVAA